MNEFKKIVYNCRKATFLIEKKQLGPISLREKMELKIHLAGCSICRLFEKQSILINHLVKGLLNEDRPPLPQLDEEHKQQLQRVIEKELDS